MKGASRLPRVQVDHTAPANANFLGDGYTEEAVRTAIQEECVICFEEFPTGSSLIRMECFCFYHDHCLREWWNKKGKRDCPVHTQYDQEDEEE